MTNWAPDLASRSGPRYRAIADALGDDIASGILAAGTRLPTHRDLAYRLGVTVGTVTRAYAEAESRGLIGGEVGRGTFVQGLRLPLPGDPATHSLSSSARLSYAAEDQGPDSDRIRADLTIIRPAHHGSAEALAATLAAIAASPDKQDLLTYSPHAGLPSHRAAGARWLARQHRVDCTPDQVLLTTGAQNALAIAFAAVARPGDVIVTERLTNYGTKTLAALEGYHLEGLPIDEDGLVPDAFDSACRRLAPKALYTVPTLQNPTASVMSQGRRAAVAEIARRHGVLIIEDDVFGFLVPDALPIQAIAPDITVYLSSVSKSLSAGLRVGYLVAPQHLVSRMESVIRALQFSIPSLPAEIISHWITNGQADRIVATQRQADTARQILARSILPASAVRGHPASQHLWLALPEPLQRYGFMAEARRRGVAVIGADSFLVGRTAAPHAVRISLCADLAQEDLVYGLNVLADAIDNPASAMLSLV